MNRRYFVTTAGTASLAGMLSADCSHYTTQKKHAIERCTPADSSQDRDNYLRSLLTKLCTDLGPRPIGSDAYNTAAYIVKEEMEKSLPVVFLDTLTYERWNIKSEAEVFISDEKIEAYISHGSRGTSPEGLGGLFKKNEDAALPFVITDSSSDVPLAYVTYYENGTARPRPYYSYKQPVKCPPIFTAGKYDVPFLEDSAQRVTTARVHAEVEFIPDTPSCNVVGTLPGKSTDEIVFLAHLDTVYSSPGANDNTASLIVMLMLAHALKGQTLNKTVTFIATTGEEYDKQGAVNYVNRRKNEGTLKSIKYLVNFDSLTWGPHIQITSQDDGLRTLMASIDRDLKLYGRPELIDGDGFALDGRPFRETGARAIYAGSIGDDTTFYCWHRPHDIPENVPLYTAENSFIMFREFILRLQDL